jgi:hypothetical protein
MNRVLKRPMFRMGGSAATGITSGLDVPRKGYKEDGLVQKQKEVTDAALKFMVDSARARGQFTDDTPSNNNMQSTADSAVGGGSSLEDAIAIARAKAREMTPSDEMTTGQFSSRFLIPFGLDLASRPPEGGLLATAARAAKGPLENLYKFSDAKKASATEKESDLFNTFLSAGLEDRRYNRKVAAEKLKESEQLLTLYDKTKGENVIVKASEVYKNLENFGPAKADKDGRPFEKLEIKKAIEETMGRIFELQNKEERTVAEEQELKEKETVLDYLKGSKNTKGFADSLLKDPNFIQDLRSRIKRRFEDTQGYKDLLRDGVTNQEKLIIQQKIDRFVNLYLETGTLPPELMLADGGRVGLAKSFPGTAGDAQDFSKMSSGDVMAAADTPKIDFDTLRARLPKEIGDDIVRLIATSPEALEDFATIQTQQDVNNFNMKYDVELILPAEA